MSGNCKSLLLLLHRCVAARRITLSTNSWARIKTQGRVLTVLGTERCGYIQHHQHHKWTSTMTPCLQSLSKHRSLKIFQLSLCTKTGPPVEDEYPPLPAYNSDPVPEKKEVFIVHAKGLPWSCTAEDILQFFSDCRIRDGVKGIHLTLNKHGKPNGHAFIELEHEDDVSKALEKHRQYLGPRYVEVFEVTNSDAETILKKSVDVQATDGVVRLRGLPFSCTEKDIVQFFSGLHIAENGVTIVLDRKGRNSGEAYVQFVSQDVADEALQRDREVIGNRYIELFPSRSSEIHSSWRRHESTSPQVKPFSTSRRSAAAQTNLRAASDESSSLPQHFIHMRGLPFQATGEDIVQFFSPLALSRILIECGPDGRASGEADVYFTCHKDAVSAMSRDKVHMGERYIELFLNSTPDINEG
ncbi:G-rich sequence factor 1 [Polymixia lowei]